MSEPVERLGRLAVDLPDGEIVEDGRGAPVLWRSAARPPRTC